MDIQMATNYARHMVLEWGMSERLGFVRYAGTDTQEVYVPEKDYSQDTNRIIDEEVKAIIDAAYADAETMVDEHWDKVCAIAEALLRYETLQSAEVTTLIEGGKLDRPTVADLLDAERTEPSPSTDKAPQQDVDPEPGDGFMPSPA